MRSSMRRRRLPAVAPIQLEQVDLSCPLPDVTPRQTPDGEPYAAAEVLVCLHDAPLGSVSLSLAGETISARDLARHIVTELGPAIERHLAQDGVCAGGPRLDQLVSVPAPCMPVLAAVPVPITVVVATRDRPRQLASCLDALLRSSYPAFDVVVVDNAPSNDATAEVVAEYAVQDRRVRYLLEPQPGASRARNRGIRAATGDLVAFTDDDVLVSEQWLHVIAAELGAGSTAALTGLTLPLRLDHPAAVCYERVGGFGMGWERRQISLTASQDTRLFPYTTACGSSNNLAVRLDVLRRVHGFDERLGPGTPSRGGEDLDLLTRLLLGGESIVYQPRALVRHEHRTDAASLGAQLFTYGAGATAVLTKWSLRRGELVQMMLRLGTAELRRALTRRVRRTSQPLTTPAPGGQPRWLVRRVLLGYAVGPFLWCRSSLRSR